MEMKCPICFEGTLHQKNIITDEGEPKVVWECDSCGDIIE